MNPWAPKRWAECVGQAIGEASFEDEPVFVTVIDDAWNHGTYPVWPTPSDLRSFMKEARKRARSLFRGLPYLFFADVGLRQIAGHFAMRVEFHIHGLVWAPLAKLRATADRQGTVENGATRLKVKRARTLDTLLEYCTKDPRIGYHSYPPRRAYSGDRWSHYRLKFAPRHLFALLNLYGDLTQPELTSASGSAAKVLMRARQFAKAQRWPGIRRVRSRAEPRL